MNIFISGGCKNGKSYHAQELARDMAEELGVPLYYLATMIPTDEEDRARIRRHLWERDGWGFETLECGLDILNCLQAADCAGSFLLDSVTALLANEMFGGALTDPALRILSDIRKIRTEAAHLTIVTNEICSGGLDYEPGTLAYMKQLGTLNCILAAEADFVCEVTAGMPNILKGGA